MIDKHIWLFHDSSMQVSIYIPDLLLKEIDRSAKQQKQSRSEWIQQILKNNIRNSIRSESVFEEVFNQLDSKEAELLIHNLRQSRKNSRRFGYR